MKPHLFGAALLSLAFAAPSILAETDALAPRAGHSSTLNLRAEIITETGSGDTYTSAITRFGNREILNQMLASSLLDGRLSGWYLGIIGEATGNPKVCALKKNRPAVEIPESLLTLPTIVHRSRKGSSANPTTAAPTSTLAQAVHSTFKVKGADVVSSGTQTLQKGNLKLGDTTTVVTTWTDTLTFTGPAPAGSGVMTGIYRTRSAKRLNITPYLGAPAESSEENPEETPEETPEENPETPTP